MAGYHPRNDFQSTLVKKNSYSYFYPNFWVLLVNRILLGLSPIGENTDLIFDNITFIYFNRA